MTVNLSFGNIPKTKGERKMECQTQAKQQEYLDQLNRSEKQNHHERMGKEGVAHGKGKNRKYYLKWKLLHPEKYEKSKKDKISRIKEIREKFPWWVHFYSAKHRCNYKHWYKDNNIKFDLKFQDVKDVWFRDKAYLMKKPSIDRIDGSKGYVRGNIRFLEIKENQQRTINNERYVKILSMFQNGLSSGMIARELRISRGTVFDYKKRIERNTGKKYLFYKYKDEKRYVI